MTSECVCICMCACICVCEKGIGFIFTVRTRGGLPSWKNTSHTLVTRSKQKPRQYMVSSLREVQSTGCVRGCMTGYPRVYVNGSRGCMRMGVRACMRMSIQGCMVPCTMRGCV